MYYVGNVQEAVTGTSLAYLPIKAANSWSTDVWDQAPDRLPKMDNQKSLMLHWCSGLGDSCNVVGIIFALQGCPYFQYALNRPRLWSISWLTRPKIVDTLLMVIVKMGQGVCRFLFCLSRWPILRLYKTATKSLFNYRTYWTYWTRNHSPFIDPHFATGISGICTDSIWHRISEIMFWLPFYLLHVLSPLSHQQRTEFLLDPPGCSWWLWWLWRNLVLSAGGWHVIHHAGDASHCLHTLWGLLYHASYSCDVSDCILPCECSLPWNRAFITLGAEWGDVYTPLERHLCCTLRRGSSYAVAVYPTPNTVYAFLWPSTTFYLSVIAIHLMPHSPHI